MLKNTASQNITFLLIDASDGSAMTGASVSGYVTKNAGSQAAAAGTITEKANGVYSYAPTQAETNADSISFLFTATGAIPVNLQVFTIDVALFKADVSALATAAAVAALNNLSSAEAQSAAAAALAAYDGPTKAELDAGLAALNNLAGSDVQSAVSTVLNAAQTESYANDGSTASVTQLLYMIYAILAEPNYSGTTLTVKKLDGSTTAMTFALNDATSPTTQTRNG